MDHHERTTSTEKHPQASNAGGVDGLHEKALSLAERLYKRAEDRGTATVLDKLNHLYQKGDKEQLDLFIDDVIYEGLQTEPEFIENMKRLRTIRSYNPSAVIKEEEQKIRDRQNELFNERKKELISLAGLPMEVGQDEYLTAREKVQAIIGQHIENGGDSDTLLQALGILTVDEHGKEAFTYPYGLFPAETDKKWGLYLDRVREHLRIDRGVFAGTRQQEELENADNMRRLSHNAVTGDVHAILGFDKLPDSQWDFAKTRNLLAKIRDHRYPTVETAEKDVTTDGVLNAAQALGVLGTKLSQLKH